MFFHVFQLSEKKEMTTEFDSDIGAPSDSENDNRPYKDIEIRFNHAVTEMKHVPDNINQPDSHDNGRDNLYSHVDQDSQFRIRDGFGCAPVTALCSGVDVMVSNGQTGLLSN